MKKILTFGLATSALLVGSVRVQAAALIDDFNTDGFSLSVDNLVTTPLIDSTDSDFSNGATSLVNERRDVSLTLIPEPGEIGGAGVQVDLDMTKDDFRHSNDVGVGSLAILTYDNGGTGLGGGAGIDLLSQGSNISLDLETIDLESEISLSFTDFGGTTVSANRTGLTSNTTLAFDFAEFAGVDFRKITSISLQSQAEPNTDLELDNFRVDGIPTPIPDNPTTPEPAAVVGLLFSLGCGALSKKKKQA